MYIKRVAETVTEADKKLQQSKFAKETMILHS